MDRNVPKKVRKRKKPTIDDLDEPSFFTVIVSPATQLHKLKLPNKFVNDHGKRLPDSALLHVPDGDNYPVKLLKLNNEVFLHKGWNQFATNYSIQAGSFLVFSFHGSSKFLVLIFDAKTALEIEYHPTNLHQIPTKNGELEAPKIDEHEQGISKEAGKARKSPLERAKAFQSAKPNFTIQIYKRNLSYNSGPSIPTDHYRSNFKRKDNNGNIILIVKNKSWTVKYRFEKMRWCYISMASGWREFALQNELQEGDVGVFEKIKSTPNTYHVHLFRVSGDDRKMVKLVTKDEEIKDNTTTEISCTKSSMTWKFLYMYTLKQLVICNVGGRGRCSPEALMEKAKAFVCDSPGFVVTMRKTYVIGSRAVHVCISHSKEYLKDEGDDNNSIAIKGEGGKAWIVKYRIEESCSRLGAGWAKFRSDNHLQIGDVCAFKLINKARKIYKLGIFRGDAK